MPQQLLSKMLTQEELPHFSVEENGSEDLIWNLLQEGYKEGQMISQEDPTLIRQQFAVEPLDLEKDNCRLLNLSILDNQQSNYLLPEKPFPEAAETDLVLATALPHRLREEGLPYYQTGLLGGRPGRQNREVQTKKIPKNLGAQNLLQLPQGGGGQSVEGERSFHQEITNCPFHRLNPQDHISQSRPRPPQRTNPLSQRFLGFLLQMIYSPSTSTPPSPPSPHQTPQTRTTQLQKNQGPSMILINLGSKEAEIVGQMADAGEERGGRNWWERGPKRGYFHSVISQHDIIFMKSHTNSKEMHSKNSSREEPRKSSAAIVNNFFKKINRSIPMTIPTKSLLLNSQRGSKPKVEPIRGPVQSQQLSSQHSRKMSIYSNAGTIVSGRGQKPEEGREGRDVTGRREKEHNRSNSTISKKSTKEIKNCFKIDLSKFKGKEEKGPRLVLESKEVCRDHFDCQYVVGKGGFGKVWSVKLKKNQRIYAMKEMHKTKIIGKKSIHSVLNERELLSKLKHPFIVNMSYAFQDRENLYLIMDLLVGGDLRYHMGCRRRFKEMEAKFFIACILLGLEYLHLNNVIHRDIKPENLVFDDRGYLRTTDLGIARLVKPNNNADTSGTPGYMAPEVMCRQDHSFPVDYYAVGVIAYELMLGRRPYYGRNRKQIRDQILSKQVQIKTEEIPPGWSIEAADFINRMIQRKPAQRLGTEHGIIAIKEHAWFKNFPWIQLLKKNIASPFIPINVLSSNDYRDQISSSSEEDEEDQNRLLLRKKSVEELFSGYVYYAKDPVVKQSKQKHKNESVGVAATAATATTHYSYLEEKESQRGKGKTNNFVKY